MRALITGITGQSGSYLAELLLDQNIEVFGLVRRSSIGNTQRINHIKDKITIIYGDLCDLTSLNHAVHYARPDWVFNLGAQSFVGESWRQPKYTFDVVAGGTLNLLEAVKNYTPNAKFYQASSSEMFGASPPPQNEMTPFYPRSPYGIAKLAAFWFCRNYRESHGLFVSNGTLFNHECVSGTTPILILKKNGIVDVVAVEDLAPVILRGRSVQSFGEIGVSVWDGEKWTKISAITATRRRIEDPDHQMIITRCYGGIVETTAHHHMLDSNFNQLPASDVAAGQYLAIAKEFPKPEGWMVATPEMAELLGLLTADGYIEKDGTTVVFTKNDAELRCLVENLWLKVFGEDGRHHFGVSGFKPGNLVGKVALHATRGVAGWLREQLYAPSGDKKVPIVILNASLEIQAQYLKGYYAGDGLKTQAWDSFVTNSEVLALGLVYLYSLQGRNYSVGFQKAREWVYYRVNLGTLGGNEAQAAAKRKPPGLVGNVLSSASPNEWIYDIETESERLMAGIGRLVVHNSPRRGIEFVTRKISHGVAMIANGKATELRLGNLDAKRDWGHARDYMRAAILMLLQDKPDDYVIGSEVAYSVQDFVERAFARANLNWKDHVVIDPAFVRPAEVNHLLADATKAKEKLGWRKMIYFQQLVEEMVDSDMQLVKEGGV